MFGLVLQRMRAGMWLLGAALLCLCPEPALAAGSAAAEEPEVEILDGKTLFRLGWGDDLCAITFDDGPSRHTPRLLEILRDHGVPATFFLVGNQIRYHGALVRRIQEEGHEIANHTLSHMTLRHREPAVQREEMETVQTMLNELGVVSRFVRPPYGRYDSETVRLATELGLEIVLWSVDSMDWTRSLRVESMRTQIRGQKLRGVFLFHDTHAPTVEAMPEILDRLAADGCRFVTLSTYLDAVHSPVTPVPPTLSVEKAPAPAPVPTLVPAPVPALLERPAGPDPSVPPSPPPERAAPVETARPGASHAVPRPQDADPASFPAPAFSAKKGALSALSPPPAPFPAALSAE